MALAISNVCNTDCLMCWSHSPLLKRQKLNGTGKPSARPPAQSFMDPQLFETIIREARAMGTFRVVLGGEGEPTLHPRFDDMLLLMTELRMEPYVLTNGLGVDEARASTWAASRAHFRFSLHAGDEETWMRVHPSGRPGQFQHISGVIKSLVQAERPAVSTTHVIHRANYRHVRSMVEHAHELGVREILFRPVRVGGLVTELVEDSVGEPERRRRLNTDPRVAELVLDRDEEAELRRLLKSGLELSERYGIRTNLRQYLADNLHIQAGVLHTEEVYQRIPCYMGWIYAEFDVDGTMRPCLHSEIAMGLAGQQPIRDIWRSPRYRRFRRQAITMPRRRALVDGCHCSSCCMVKYNTNVHNLLHLKSLDYGAP
ncbi:MAG: radical SAM protein [Anaerolineae bacterium]|jgi:MoaA/NifB/PqqE/SkfB family radical SAM enzyme